jgi:threonine synthase
MERLRHLIPELADLRAAVQSYPVDDAEIRAQIAKDFERFGEVWCPHTATGFHAYDHLPEADRRASAWAVCATAHPAKFETIVEAVIGQTVDVPPALAAILELPASSIALEPDLDALRRAVADWTE